MAADTTAGEKLGMDEMLIVGELTSIPGFCFFHLVLLFWNQIFTWVSVKLRLSARFSLSHTDKYLVVLNLFSKATNCSYVKAVLARRDLDALLLSLSRFLDLQLDELSDFEWLS